MSFNATKPQDLKLLPPKLEITDEVKSLLLQARVEIAELKGYSFSLNNPFLLLSPAAIKEAVASSEIENIHTTVINVLENQLFPEEEQSQPDKEVLRYREALYWGYENIKKYGISTRLIKGIHKKLLLGGGSYRKTQNAITQGGGVIRYTPPLQSNISDYLGNLENFINDNNPNLDPLLKAIISHYQFESIHPFIDGNGRTGRILMILTLVQDNLLNPPVLFISGYINSHKNEYYDSLLEVTKNNNWNDYLIFMLKGFTQQARETKDLALQVKNAYFDLKQNLKVNHTDIYSADLLETLFTYPVINPSKLSDELGVHRSTASRHLKNLEKVGILKKKSVGTYILYANVPLLKVLHQHNKF